MRGLVQRWDEIRPKKVVTVKDESLLGKILSFAHVHKATTGCDLFLSVIDWIFIRAINAENKLIRRAVNGTFMVVFGLVAIASGLLLTYLIANALYWYGPMAIILCALAAVSAAVLLGILCVLYRGIRFVSGHLCPIVLKPEREIG